MPNDTIIPTATSTATGTASDAASDIAEAVPPQPALPAAITTIVQALLGDTGLDTAWSAVKADNPNADLATFCSCISYVTGRSCDACALCGEPAWTDDCSTDADGELICEDCRPECYSCDRCDELHRDADDMTWVGDDHYCDACRSSCCSYCDNCDEWYHDDDSGEHQHDRDDDCWCEAPHPRFTFPANGAGSVAQDQRLLVELPAGVIDPRGIQEISAQLWATLKDGEVPLCYTELIELVEGLDPTWQSSRGNFTRRLSAALYQGHGVKLPAGLLSSVGNLARQHSSSTSAWHIVLTRDLNQNAEDFYHEDSCWWGEYSYSRCALKNWGGMGLLSYSDSWSFAPTGRAWVQPLNDGLQPTHDAFGAHAYLVYNGYGDLEGSNAARIVAHLTSRTYRRVDCDIRSQFVNNDAGYLVADEVTCASVDSVMVTAGTHFEFDADLLRQRLVNAAAPDQQAA